MKAYGKRQRAHRRRPLPALPKRRGCQCLCHVIQFGGKPCPLDCKKRGMRFDGCHACDCLKKCRKQKAATRALRELAIDSTLIQIGRAILGLLDKRKKKK